MTLATDFVLQFCTRLDLRRLRHAHEEIVANEQAATVAEQIAGRGSIDERIRRSGEASRLRAHATGLWRKLRSIDERP